MDIDATSPCEAPFVHLRDGRLVEMSHERDPEPRELEGMRMLSPSLRLALAQARQVKPATGRYNCHGLVLASRRGNIPRAGERLDIEELLRADGYIPNARTETPVVGDIAAYVDDRGDVEHTGFVCRVDAFENVPKIWIWSAWGSLGEYVHEPHVSIYDGSVTYWRLA